MKAFRIVLTIGAAVFLTSCVSMKTSDLKHSNRGCVQLPTLEPRVDLSSIESVYSMGTATSSSVGYGTAIGKSSAIGSSVSVSQMTKDPRVQDVITIFDREVKDCITNPYGEKKGYIVCKFASGESKLNWGIVVLSSFTLFVPNMLGMPLYIIKTNIDLIVEIYDNNERLIGRYSAEGFDKSKTGFYYGYYPKSLSRITGVNAYKESMEKIKVKIEQDKDRIIKDLN